MSKYTTEVRFVCEMYAGLTESTGLSGVDNVIEQARSKVFDFAYPIFDEAYRSVLESKILKHFYTREIGAETVGLWKLWLNTRMNEIMPYYNKLYKSELLDFNPLYDVDLTREHSATTDGKTVTTGETTGVSSNKDNSYYSDTPQGGVGNLLDLSYLTDATIGEGTTNTTGTTSNNSTINNTEEYLERVRGKNGGTSYAKMLDEYRATFLNIDMQVINDLNDLFMNLW